MLVEPELAVPHRENDDALVFYERAVFPLYPRVWISFSLPHLALHSLNFPLRRSLSLLRILFLI